MKPDSDPYKIPYRLSFCVVCLLTVFSLLLYKERMFFVDPCWVTFNIINTKTFSIPEYRFGSFITQIYPLAGVYLGLPVKTLLILYSVSFYIFYLGTVFLAGVVWKQKWLGIILALYLTVFVSDVYFWPNNEVHQGITWMILFLSLFLYSGHRTRKFYVHIALFLFAFFAISSHLLVIPAFLFLWGYIQIEKQKTFRTFFRDRNSVLYSALIICLIAIRYWVSTSGWYDGTKLAGVKLLTIGSALSSFRSAQSRSFFVLLIKNYWIMIPVCLAATVWLMRYRKYVQFSLWALFILGYYMLICITYPEAIVRNMLFYFESEWMALSIIMATPFVIHIVPLLAQKRMALLVFVMIFGVRFAYMANSYTYFNNRFKKLESITTSFQSKGVHNAFLLMNKRTSDSLFIMDWGLPIESMMLSESKGYALPTTVKGIDTSFDIRQARDSFYSCFDVVTMAALDKKYFVLDTNQYKVYQLK
jgi:hypothetical protein